MGYIRLGCLPHLIVYSFGSGILFCERRIRYSFSPAKKAHGAENGWIAPMTEADKAFFAYFRSVFKRYNISPSKATRLEYDFVTRVAENEFYLQKANA